ncbi:mechanosensitive ion channel [Thalassotalea sp. M1531]|uniref:Small-conductance mechanosensitive channel n=2 Tax=Thalassotalea algicola TaxID=2716224 RepID=A0A7Y0LA57_9GAMM|nr:mechanosensitive ion channel [Thalassotalea algicola]
MNTSVDKLEHYMQIIGEMGLAFGTKLILAIIVWIIGAWVIRRIVKLIDVAMTKKKVEVTLHQFLVSIFNITFKAVLIIIFASMIGVETASLIAMLGAAGLAVGLALQGSLANFAGGILILFFRPFKAGDVIEAQGYVGTVVEIQIFNTIMRTLDNQRVIIPNGLLSNGCVKNLFIEDTRRVDMTFGISYGDDIKQAKAVLQQVMDNDSRVLKDPTVDIFVSAHADSSINFVVRPWVNSEDYWPVFFATHEAVKIAFDEAGISIPFPQRDVHLIQSSD